MYSVHTIQYTVHSTCTVPSGSSSTSVLVSYWAVLVPYRTGAVMTPVLHVDPVLNVLHQMRTPKLHVHHDKNPQKGSYSSFQTTKTTMILFCCANRVRSHGCHDSVLHDVTVRAKLSRTFLRESILRVSST